MAAKGRKFLELVALVDRLRGPDGCPWDREQTFDTLKPLLLEEAYETLEALDSGDRTAFRSELGDLLFQVAFLSQMAESEGAFDIDEVADGVVGKMVRRHPHVFGEAKADSAEGVLRQWEDIKRRERSGGSDDGSSEESILDHLPRMPALLTALKITGKASRVGFDWSHIDGVVEKLEEEIGELRQALDSPPGGKAGASRAGGGGPALCGGQCRPLPGHRSRNGPEEVQPEVRPSIPVHGGRSAARGQRPRKLHPR